MALLYMGLAKNIKLGDKLVSIEQSESEVLFERQAEGFLLDLRVCLP
jgi:hypothetical protein